MNQIKNLVSVIMPAYNSEEFIEEAVNSVINQSYKEWELIITDDCSDDCTFQVISSLASKDKRIKVLKNEVNSGAAVSRNNSISHSKGRYLAFLDADDIWESNKLESQLGFMEKKGAAFSFTSYQLINDSGIKLNSYVDVKSQDTIEYDDLLCKKCTVGCSTVIVDRKLVGNFSMPLIRARQDYATWLEILKRGFKAHLYKEPLTLYRLTSGSISRNKFKVAKKQWYVYRNIEKLGFFKSLYYFINYAYRAVFRK